MSSFYTGFFSGNVEVLRLAKECEKYARLFGNKDKNLYFFIRCGCGMCKDNDLVEDNIRLIKQLTEEDVLYGRPFDKVTLLYCRASIYGLQEYSENKKEYLEKRNKYLEYFEKSGIEYEEKSITIIS